MLGMKHIPTVWHQIIKPRRGKLGRTIWTQIINAVKNHAIKLWTNKTEEKVELKSGKFLAACKEELGHASIGFSGEVDKHFARFYARNI